jgi:hypothetical protein
MDDKSGELYGFFVFGILGLLNLIIVVEIFRMPKRRRLVMLVIIAVAVSLIVALLFSLGAENGWPLILIIAPPIRLFAFLKTWFVKKMKPSTAEVFYLIGLWIAAVLCSFCVMNIALVLYNAISLRSL